MSRIDVQATWDIPAGASSARVVDPQPSEILDRTHPRYIALTVGPTGRGSVTIHFEDTAAAEQLVEVLIVAISEKHRRDEADAAPAVDGEVSA